MKALTLRQPWPYAVCYLGKDIENRTWEPSLEVGDYLAIHGGKKPTGGWALEEAILDQQYICDLADISGFPENWALEGIVAVAKFGGLDVGTSSVWTVKGQHHWKLEDVKVLSTPVPCKGAQGLWTVPESVLEQVRAAYSRTSKTAT